MLQLTCSTPYITTCHNASPLVSLLAVQLQVRAAINTLGLGKEATTDTTYIIRFKDYCSHTSYIYRYKPQTLS